MPELGDPGTQKDIVTPYQNYWGVKYALTFDFQLTKEEELLVAQLMANERLYNAIIARVAGNAREVCTELIETEQQRITNLGFGTMAVYKLGDIAASIRSRTPYQEKVASLGPMCQSDSAIVTEQEDSPQTP